MSYLPDFKFTPIEEGLKETVEWFIENYTYARK
jgi:GDP-L-fucose synthase